MTGEIDCLVFPQLFGVVKGKLEPDRVLYLTGKIHYKDEQVSLICESILDAQQLQQKLDSSRLCCKVRTTEREKMQQITAIAGQHAGTVPLVFYLTDAKKMVAPRTQIGTDLSEALFSALRQVLGVEQMGLI
jgi:DNA polymerase-3 subunit alpha